MFVSILRTSTVANGKDFHIVLKNTRKVKKPLNVTKILISKLLTWLSCRGSLGQNSLESGGGVAPGPTSFTLSSTRLQVGALSFFLGVNPAWLSNKLEQGAA